MAHITLIQLLLSHLILTAAAVGQSTICVWTQIRAAVVHDALYLEGGWKWLLVGTDIALTNEHWNGSMYKLNFSSSFDLSSSNFNFTNLLDTVSISTSPNQVPDYYNGFMFADAYEMYTYGGLPNGDVSSYPLANFLYGYQFYEKDVTVQRPQLGSDSPSLVLPDNVLSRYLTNGAGVNVPSEYMGYYFGGFQGSNSSFDEKEGLVPADTLISINMDTEASPLWTNSSLTTNNPNVLTRADAGLVWIPTSTQGILIAIGGVRYSDELLSNAFTTSDYNSDIDSDAAFMQSLPVYDIANDAWYVQTISGTDHPPALGQFCSVVVSAKDSSSYEIYIYGGTNSLDHGTPPQLSDDVWVLSVPSFTWTKVYPGNNDQARFGHVCATPYPNQMFVVGGGGYDGGCINGSAIRVFDLNNLVWQTKYDPAVWEEYKVPTKVASAIAATPTAAWSQPQISKLFSTSYTGDIITYYPYTSISSGGHHTPVGAIAGGAAGGACLIVLILALIWYRRKHRRPSGDPDSEVQPYEQVSRWQRGVAKTEPSVTTTEVDDGAAINPNTGGYYKPAEAPGDQAYRPPSQVSSRPGVFAEAGGGTRRISGGATISPRSPHSPQSGTLVPHEADGEERYEMDDMAGQRGSGDAGARYLFRDHSMYPLSVSDGDGTSQASGPSHGGMSYSTSQASRGGEADHLVPAPYMMARPASGIEDAELPASPVSRRLDHTRNISSISSALPKVSPPLEQATASNPMVSAHHATTSSEDDLDALEAFHTGSPTPFRPAHKRNPSSMSNKINQLPTPEEEVTEEEEHRQSRLLATLPLPADGATPTFKERNPLIRGVKVGEDVYSPSSYNSGTLVGTRSPVTRKPVGQGLGIERAI
jgi:Kelch motif